MRSVVTIILFSLFLLPNVGAQNLLNERIRKISARKRSIYLDRGIFHNGNKKVPSTLKSMRHSFSSKKGYERLVLDFSTKIVPRVYGYFSTEQKRLYIDLFDTAVNPKLKSLGQAKFVESVNFFPLDGETLSLEIALKKKVNLDVFYLENPGRLVVDIKD